MAIRSLAAFVSGMVVCTGVMAQTEGPIYTNEIGEEIFGPDYMPDSVADPGEAYLIGRPSAGYAVPDSLLALPQDAFDQELLLRSAPAEAGARSLPLVPLVKDKADALREILPDLVMPDFRSPLRSAAPPERGGPPSTMFAHFVNVGQGDGAILEFPCQVALIDVGGEWGSDLHGDKLFLDYLKTFFAERPHLNNTIDVVFLTHPHADHINGVTGLLDKDGHGPFKVKSVVDNGQSGTESLLKVQSDFRRQARAKGASYSAVEVKRQTTATGITNGAIDPIVCPGIDPVITAFWGGANELIPTSNDYDNPNNHSVVVRVDFGRASFLFTGDLEDRGERDMREKYALNLGMFDVDVYQVSHHGPTKIPRTN